MRRNSMKKFLACALGVIVMVSSMGMSASAAYKTVTYSGQFSSAWSKVAYADNSRGRLEYGFNTFLINEDYAYAYHITQTHQVTIQNTSLHRGPVRNSGEYSKLEVTHRGSSVQYSIKYW